MVWRLLFLVSSYCFLLINEIVCVNKEIPIADASFNIFWFFSAERQRLYALKNQACLWSAWNMAAEISMMSRNTLLLDSCFLCTMLVEITFFGRLSSICTVSSRGIWAAFWYLNIPLFLTKQQLDLVSTGSCTVLFQLSFFLNVNFWTSQFD